MNSEKLKKIRQLRDLAAMPEKAKINFWILDENKLYRSDNSISGKMFDSLWQNEFDKLQYLIDKSLLPDTIENMLKIHLEHDYVVTYSGTELKYFKGSIVFVDSLEQMQEKWRASQLSDFIIQSRTDSYLSLKILFQLVIISVLTRDDKQLNRYQNMTKEELLSIDSYYRKLIDEYQVINVCHNILNN